MTMRARERTGKTTDPRSLARFRSQVATAGFPEGWMFPAGVTPRTESRSADVPFCHLRAANGLPDCVSSIARPFRPGDRVLAIAATSDNIKETMIAFDTLSAATRLRREAGFNEDQARVLVLRAVCGREPGHQAPC